MHPENLSIDGVSESVLIYIIRETIVHFSKFAFTSIKKHNTILFKSRFLSDSTTNDFEIHYIRIPLRIANVIQSTVNINKQLNWIDI